MKKFITGLFLAGLLVAVVTGCNPPILVDVTAPTVSSVVPVNAATGVAVNGVVTATFSEAMNSATITSATFTLAGAAPVSGVVTLNDAGTMATFNPAADLAVSTAYTATITIGAADVAGNALASAFVWSFTTAAAPAAGPAPLVLGTAGNYVILTKTGIT